MRHTIRLLTLLTYIVIFVSCSQPRAETGPQLNGQHVANISRDFLLQHYSHPRFDDDQSTKMLLAYLNRLDPGHVYFLQGDIEDFQRYSKSLDDLVPKGNISAAFLIFDRLKQRMADVAGIIGQVMSGEFDLESEDSRVVGDKDKPYPKDLADAKRIWAKRLKFEMLEIVLTGKSKKEAKQDLKRRYRSQRTRVRQFSRNEVVSMFINAFTSTFDPHSGYMTPDDLENFNINMRLSLDGIGARLRWEDGYTVITSIIPGGAAAREGSLKPEDKIVGVAQGHKGAFKEVDNVRLIEVVNLIRGRRGTVVRLALLRKTNSPVEKRLVVTITREKIVLKNEEAKGRILTRQRGGKKTEFKIGIITLPSFYVDFSKRASSPNSYKSASRDVADILKRFMTKRVDGVILDLRNNGGGGLEEAVSLAGLFLNDGPVVIVKSLSGRVKTYPNPRSQALFRGPLMVITNRFSASASEIVAGALKDYGRAVLVGDQTTFGKGTVQNIFYLRRGLGALKTTVAKFYRPGSSSTQNRGVTPHIVLPSMNNELDLGEASFENALPWDSIGKRAFNHWGNLNPYLPILKARSNKRVNADPKFRVVRDRIAEYRKRSKGRRVVKISQMIEESRKRKKTSPAASSLQPGQEDDTGSREENFYLNESVEILLDYIQISSTSQHQVVNQ